MSQNTNSSVSDSASTIETEPVEVADSSEPRRSVWKRVVANPTVRSVALCTAATLTLVKVIDVLLQAKSDTVETEMSEDGKSLVITDTDPSND